jgi:hypothetical protein
MYKQITINGILQNTILRMSDNAFIPFNEDNKDYQEYLKWLKEGNTPLPADEDIDYAKK